MDPRDVIYFTEHRIEKFRRERQRQQLVRHALLNAPRPARIFRFLASFRRAPDTTTG